MKKLIILLAVAALSSCQSTRTEMFQGQPVEMKPGEAFVHQPVKDESREMMNLMFDVLF
jgi:curli biogenesis system outer membrane secretion channel CsgG